MLRSRFAAILIVLLGASSYGLLSSLIKLAYNQGWNTAEISTSQMTMGTLVVWILVAVTPHSRVNPFKGPWLRFSLIGIFGLSLTTIFYNVTLSLLPASLSIVLLFQFTWVTILLESIALQRWPTFYQWIAVGFIVVGTFLAVNLFAADFSHIGLKGMVFGFLSAITYSLFIFGTGRVKTTMPSLMKSAVMLTAALPFVYFLYPPYYLIQGGAFSLLLWGLLLGLFGQVIPTIAFNIGIPKVGSSLAAMLGSMELPVAIFGALVLLNESVFAFQWVGMALILVGIVLSEKKTKKVKKRNNLDST